MGYGAIPAVGDLDGDGDQDVLVGRSDGTHDYFLNGAPVLQATLAGPQGYRALASPVPGALINDLMSSFHTQGMPGSSYPPAAPSVFVYDETVGGDLDQGWGAPATLATAASAGRGYLAYVYADDDPGTAGEQGGFPKILSVTPGPLVTQMFSWGGPGEPISYTDTGSPADDGWNLLGNPFAGWMDWDATGSTGLDASAYVYDGVSSQYLAYSRGVGGTLPGGVIAAFTGFWVQANAPSPTLDADPSASSGGPLYGKAGDPGPRIALALAPEAGGPLSESLRSSSLLALGVADARVGVSPMDAVALIPPASEYVLVGTRALGTNGTETPLAVDVRPEISGTVVVPVDIKAAGVSGSVDLELTWPRLENIPGDWSLTLRDGETGAQVDMLTSASYSFTLLANEQTRQADRLGPALVRASGSERFSLVIQAGGVVSIPESAPTELALTAARPNPTTGATDFRLLLPEAASVRATLIDARGRNIRVVMDGDYAAGQRRIDIVEGLPPGVYAVLVDVATGSNRNVLTSRFVVIR